MILESFEDDPYDMTYNLSLYSCYRPFRSNNISDCVLLEFVMLNKLRQAFVGYSHSTLHDIFPAPPNMVTRLNNVMKTCVVQVNITKPHTKLEDCLHLIVKF
jgi:hypothetical protein